ncbi:hypothetical protein Dda_2136 [Drechslerella dactyloides]|uniref:Uncharacterized protein n=1 Tax=Drechslerella dactyloides TaxID=74499 RepID=A0AAD6NMC5_DREDA|nr:hypothetical protein Dda_2136 [Drechslerella dactyloides]
MAGDGMEAGSGDKSEVESEVPAWNAGDDDDDDDGWMDGREECVWAELKRRSWKGWLGLSAIKAGFLVGKELREPNAGKLTSNETPRSPPPRRNFIL